MEELLNIVGRDRAVIVHPSLAIKGVVPWEKAVVLLLFRDAYSLLDREDKTIRSLNFEMPMPVVVAQKSKIITKRFRDDDIVSKATVKARDNYKCQYCGGYGNTVDHIVPRASGGKSTWGNMCACCTSCNFKKGDKSLAEVGYPTPLIADMMPTFSQSRLQTALYKALEAEIST